MTTERESRDGIRERVARTLDQVEEHIRDRSFSYASAAIGNAKELLALLAEPEPAVVIYSCTRCEALERVREVLDASADRAALADVIEQALDIIREVSEPDPDDPMCERCGHDPRTCDPVEARTVSRSEPDPEIDYGPLGDAFQVEVAAKVLLGELPAESIDTEGLGHFVRGLAHRLRRPGPESAETSEGEREVLDAAWFRDVIHEARVSDPSVGIAGAETDDELAEALAAYVAEQLRAASPTTD